MKKHITIALALCATLLCATNAMAQNYQLYFGADKENALADGDTIEYMPTAGEFLLGKTVTCNVYIKNITDQAILTTQEAVLLAGPEGQELELCANGSCPWNGQAYNVEPGMDTLKPITVEVDLKAEYTGVSLVRLTVFNADTRENSVTVYLRIQLSKNGIATANNGNSGVKAYPNPTHGRVTVGDTQHDLTGYPSGIYYIPYKGTAVRVIKL